MQRVRSTTCLYLRSSLRKRGVERVKIRPPKGIRNDQLASYNFYWMAYGNILFLFIFNISISQKAPIMKILARSQFCLLTILLHLQLVLWLTFFFFTTTLYLCVIQNSMSNFCPIYPDKKHSREFHSKWK